MLREVARPPVLRPPEVRGGWVPGSDGLDGDVEVVDDPFDGIERLSDPPGEPDDAGRLAARAVRPAAAVAAVLLALVVAAVVWARSAPPAAPVAVLPPRSSTPPASIPQSAAVRAAGAPGDVAAVGAGGPVAPPVASPRSVVVDVEGRVRRPGLVHLPAGARVADALASAGGATSGAVVSHLNLARVLADGEQVLVPGPGDPVAEAAPPAAPGAPGVGAGAAAPAEPLDLNAATPAALDQLPGVGPVLAGRIVAWRAAHGRFTSVDELGEVEGIGPKALERLRALVRV